LEFVWNLGFGIWDLIRLFSLDFLLIMCYKNLSLSIEREIFSGGLKWQSSESSEREIKRIKRGKVYKNRNKKINGKGLAKISGGTRKGESKSPVGAMEAEAAIEIFFYGHTKGVPFYFLIRIRKQFKFSKIGKFLKNKLYFYLYEFGIYFLFYNFIIFNYYS
jgi:hypothetical protein